MRKTLYVLGETLATKDPYTRDHALRVKTYSVGLARSMGWSRQMQQRVGVCALLHDIGKVFCDGAVLTKPGSLTPEELEHIRAHPAQGAELARRLHLHPMVVAGINAHHEWYDGRGYPDGLVGDQIPALARVVAVADVYDALTSERSYRRALPAEQATAYLLAHRGTQFDPVPLDRFVAYLPGLLSEIHESSPPPEAFGVTLEVLTDYLAEKPPPLGKDLVAPSSNL